MSPAKTSASATITGRECPRRRPRRTATMRISPERSVVRTSSGGHAARRAKAVVRALDGEPVAGVGEEAQRDEVAVVVDRDVDRAAGPQLVERTRARDRCAGTASRRHRRRRRARAGCRSCRRAGRAPRASTRRRSSSAAIDGQRQRALDDARRAPSRGRCPAPMPNAATADRLRHGERSHWPRVGRTRVRRPPLAARASDRRLR